MAGLYSWMDGSTTTTDTAASMTRKRRVKLINIANKILEEVERLGVKEDERCEFGKICEFLWR